MVSKNYAEATGNAICQSHSDDYGVGRMNEELKQERDEVFDRLITWLNDNDRFQSGVGGLFDCGALGCCYVYQDSIGWTHRWYTLESLPWQAKAG